jgi:hypothetical protein
MRYEAEGKLAEAQKIYDAILEEDESNIVGVTRCIWTCQGLAADPSYCMYVSLYPSVR